MTEADKQSLLSALRAVEQLHFQNLALETLLEFYKVPNWNWRPIGPSSRRCGQDFRRSTQSLSAILICRWFKHSCYHFRQQANRTSTTWVAH